MCMCMCVSVCVCVCVWRERETGEGWSVINSIETIRMEYSLSFSQICTFRTFTENKTRLSPTQDAQGRAKRLNKLSGSILWQRVVLWRTVESEFRSCWPWKCPGGRLSTGELGYRRARAFLVCPDLLSHYPVLEPYRNLHQVLSLTLSFPPPCLCSCCSLPQMSFLSDVSSLSVPHVPATGHLLLQAGSHIAQGMSRCKWETDRGPIRHHRPGEPWCTRTIVYCFV